MRLVLCLSIREKPATDLLLSNTQAKNYQPTTPPEPDPAPDAYQDIAAYREAHHNCHFLQLLNTRGKLLPRLNIKWQQARQCFEYTISQMHIIQAEDWEAIKQAFNTYPGPTTPPEVMLDRLVKLLTPEDTPLQVKQHTIVHKHLLSIHQCAELNDIIGVFLGDCLQSGLKHTSIPSAQYAESFISNLLDIATLKNIRTLFININTAYNRLAQNHSNTPPRLLRFDDTNHCQAITENPPPQPTLEHKRPEAFQKKVIDLTHDYNTDGQEVTKSSNTQTALALQETTENTEPESESDTEIDVGTAYPIFIDLSETDDEETAQEPPSNIPSPITSATLETRESISPESSTNSASFQPPANTEKSEKYISSRPVTAKALHFQERAAIEHPHTSGIQPHSSAIQNFSRTSIEAYAIASLKNLRVQQDIQKSLSEENKKLYAQLALEKTHNPQWKTLECPLVDSSTELLHNPIYKDLRLVKYLKSLLTQIKPCQEAHDAHRLYLKVQINESGKLRSIAFRKYYFGIAHYNPLVWGGIDTILNQGNQSINSYCYKAIYFLQYGIKIDISTQYSADEVAEYISNLSSYSFALIKERLLIILGIQVAKIIFINVTNFDAKKSTDEALKSLLYDLTYLDDTELKAKHPDYFNDSASLENRETSISRELINFDRRHYLTHLLALLKTKENNYFTTKDTIKKVTQRITNQQKTSMLTELSTFETERLKHEKAKSSSLHHKKKATSPVPKMNQRLSLNTIERDALKQTTDLPSLNSNLHFHTPLTEIVKGSSYKLFKKGEQTSCKDFKNIVKELCTNHSFPATDNPSNTAYALCIHSSSIPIYSDKRKDDIDYISIVEVNLSDIRGLNKLIAGASKKVNPIEQIVDTLKFLLYKREEALFNSTESNETIIDNLNTAETRSYLLTQWHRIVGIKTACKLYNLTQEKQTIRRCEYIDITALQEIAATMQTDKSLDSRLPNDTLRMKTSGTVQAIIHTTYHRVITHFFNTWQVPTNSEIGAIKTKKSLKRASSNHEDLSLPPSKIKK